MKAKHFEDNSYLYRAPDLSGSVYFYEPEGGLVNGWGNTNINVCARFFDYYTTIKDQVSMLWHECYHLENGHNQAYQSIKYEDDLYSRIPPELKDAFDAMVDSRVSKAYPDLKGRNREDQLIWKREDFTIIYILSAPQKYINEINTYKAEMERVSAVSLDYSIERHFMLWKNQELLRLSQIYNNNQ